MASKLSHFDLESKFEMPTKVYDAIASHGLYSAIKAAIDLGIFEYLDKNKDVCTAKKIVNDLSLSLEITRAILDTCVSLDLLTKEIPDGNPEFATYSNTTQTEHFMLRQSPKSLVPLVTHVSDIHLPLLAHLSSAAKEGCSQWPKAFNRSSEDVYKNVFANKAELTDFVSALGSHSAQAVSWILSAFDLSEYKQLCDLGGCGGRLAYTACSLYPHMKIKVFDLPQVVEVAPDFKPSLKDCPNQNHVTFIGGDFFQDDLPEADIFCLTGILENWGDDKGDLLLAKVFNKLPAGGGVLIGQTLLDEDRRGPKEALSFNLLMCVATDGGREKSGKEFQVQLQKHGFVDVRFKKNPNFPYFYGVVFGKKP